MWDSYAVTGPSCSRNGPQSAPGTPYIEEARSCPAPRPVHLKFSQPPDCRVRPFVFDATSPAAISSRYRAMSVRLGIGALVLLSLAAVPALAAPQYQLTKTVKLGAPDRWDYVVYDAPSHRVYIAHGDRVSVVDGRDGTILGEVAPFPGGTHGTAIAAAVGRGYTDDGKAGIAGSFDLKTLKPIKQIPAAPDADGMIFDPASGHVFVVD